MAERGGEGAGGNKTEEEHEECFQIANGWLSVARELDITLCGSRAAILKPQPPWGPGGFIRAEPGVCDSAGQTGNLHF